MILFRGIVGLQLLLVSCPPSHLPLQSSQHVKDQSGSQASLPSFPYPVLQKPKYPGFRFA